MRLADNVNYLRAKVTSRRAPLLVLCLTCAFVSVAAAQSGRAPRPQARPQTSPERPRTVRGVQKNQERPPAFIVLTAAPDTYGLEQIYSSYSQQSPNFEYHARGGFQTEVKKLPGATFIEDEDMARWEARETATGETDAWVVWMELKWGATSPTDPSQFRLRYLLLEPRTGRLVSSGYGSAVKHTWSGPLPPRTSLEEQVRAAGRNVAAQVVSELRKAGALK